MMNLLEINKRLKQRPPFQMIERVTALEENKSATGIKCVSVNEPHFAGHFPDAPIMPGVLIIESAAQLCSLVISPDDSSSDDKLYVLLKVKDFKFIRPVIPGDRLEITVEVVRATAAAYEFSAAVSADGVTKAKGSLMFTSMDRDKVYE